ncbi:MAG: hypothetical protein Fur0035_20030 [Anaerolineales bacterium]
MSKLKSPLSLFFATLALILLLALFGPEEKSLGANVRIVYLHGAWVIAAEAAFLAAGAAGALALLGGMLRPARFASLHSWSAALGRSGIIFWVSYLPLSLWAMQTNWNGLFLVEPRFQLALTFAIVGVLMQAGLWLLKNPSLTSAANLAYIVLLRVIFAQASNIMHPPPSPILKSGLWNVILFFVALNLLSWLAAGFLTLAWRRAESSQI